MDATQGLVVGVLGPWGSGKTSLINLAKGAPSGTVRVGAKSRIEPKDVDYLAATLRPTLDDPVLIAAPYLSPRTQERLRSRGFAYADLTGNVRLELTEPGLFIETTEARENPEPSRGTASL